jgi:dihydroorotase
MGGVRAACTLSSGRRLGADAAPHCRERSAQRCAPNQLYQAAFGELAAALAVVLTLLVLRARRARRSATR